MGAQKIATGIGLAALVALLVSVGLPAVLPPGPVAEIEIVVPAGNDDGNEPTGSPEPTPVVPPARSDDDEPDDDEPGDDEPDDDEPGDDEPDDDDGDDDGDDADDGPAGSPDDPSDDDDDTPDDDDGDDGDDADD
jgi:hypothetical protein